MTDLYSRLAEYQKKHRLTTKGTLATILHVSRIAKEKGLPLDSTILVAASKGQVQGLGKDAVQAILKDYGIVRVLAEEGGRTSRGSLGNMHDYVIFLNGLHKEKIADMAAIEKWWAERVNDFFSAQPFVLRYDTGRSLRVMVRDLLAQAIKRQKDNPGTQYAGAILQHLVGAKLSLVLPKGTLEHHGFSVSDAVSARGGDFVIDDVIIHVTMTPGEALMRKCVANLQAGTRPIIVTVHASMPAAESLAEIQGIAGRVDALEAEQFIATNLYELSFFKTTERKVTVEKLVARYNEIVDDCETDPSLKIVL
jgi:hypothetical protein